MKGCSLDLFACLTETEKKQGKLRGMVSAAIENKRYELNMTQKELAEELGVTQGMVSKLESAEYNITIDKLVELFELLKIDYNINIDGKSCVSNQFRVYNGIKYDFADYCNSFEYTGKHLIVAASA